MHPRDLSVILAAFTLVGCDEPEAHDGAQMETLGPRSLISAHSWSQAPSDADPFAALRPPGAMCDEAGLTIEPSTEGDALEIDTQLCNYVTVEQGALDTAYAGDSLSIHLWHADLESDQPATGYVGVAIGETIVWEVDVPIPSEAGPIDDAFPLPEAIELGDPIRVHVHNHGANTWDVLDLRVDG